MIVDDVPYRPRSSKQPRHEQRRVRRSRRPEEPAEETRPASEPIRSRRRVDRPLSVDRPAKPEPPPEIFAPAWQAVARGVAFFLGAFLLLILLGEVRGASHDANLGWIDLRPCSAEVARGLLGACGSLLLLFAVHPIMPGFFRGLTILAVLALFGAALWNSYVFYQQFRAGEIHAKIPVAFPLHVAALSAVVFSGLIGLRGRSSNLSRDLFLAMFSAALCVASFPLAQFFCQGKVDNRRAADVAVVFACDVPPGAKLEQTLETRVRAACQLYEEKLVRKLILVAGPGKQGEEETEILRRLAVEQGVPEADLIPDTSGSAVESAVQGTLDLCEKNDLHNLLVVSDFYLLPRIKLCFRRFGKDVDTVPAVSEAGDKSPRASNEALAQEASALWVFYIQPLVF